MESIYTELHKKYDLFFADAELSRVSPIIPIEKKYRLPLACEADYINKLHQVLKDWNIDLLVPGVDEELSLVSRAQERFNPTKLFLPDTLFISQMNDKLEMANLFQKKGLAVPKSVRADFLPTDFSYPVIVKPRFGRGAREVFEICSEKKLAAYLAVLGQRSPEFLIQEKVVGAEFTVQMIVDPDGELKAVLPIRVIEKRGSTISAVLEPEATVESYCREIHRVLGGKGCYNVQLVKGNDNECWCFEINPRVSTTFCMAIRAGLDPFSLYFNGKNNMMSHAEIPRLKLDRHWVNHYQVLG